MGESDPSLDERVPLIDRWTGLPLWQRRAVKAITGLVVLVFLTGLVYHYILVVFEGRSPTFAHSVQVVIETATGTGFGSDSPWESAVANAFVSVLDLSTFLLLFLVVPYVFRPILQEAFTPSLPESLDRSDHVVICGVPRQGQRLVDELDANDEAFLVVAEDEDAAFDLQDRDVPVIHGDPTDAEVLGRANVENARAVVVDTDDTHSASVVLAVREVDEAVRTIVLSADLEHERHLRYAGADKVLTPRHLLGRRLADRVASVISPSHTDTVELGNGLGLLELSVPEGSQICDRTVAEIEAFVEASIDVIGVWKGGTFDGSPSGEIAVDADTSLLLSGPVDVLEDLEEETHVSHDHDPTIVVAGYGIVGSTVSTTLRESGITCSVVNVDVVDGPEIDVVGDASEEETLREAAVEEANILVVAVPEDDDAVLTVLVADELGENLDIVVRVNESANATKVRRAGAEYVLGLPEISGRMVAQEVLHEEILSSNRQLKIIREDATPLAGRTLDETDITDTHCIVVGVEREGGIETEISPRFEFQAGDHILLVGSDEEVDLIAERTAGA